MGATFEIIQIIEVFGIIAFSLVSVYYGVRVLLIHLSVHHKLMSCCWITLIQTLTQVAFVILYIYLIYNLLGRDVIVFRTFWNWGNIFETHNPYQ
jgi:hypothetical protein